MIGRPKSIVWIALVALGIVSGGDSAANASWLTIRNDTRQPVVVQETSNVNGRVKRGKPATLLPGESLREFLSGPIVKQIEIFDPKRSSSPLWSGDLKCKEEMQSFAISSAGGRVAVQPIARRSPPKK